MGISLCIILTLYLCTPIQTQTSQPDKKVTNRKDKVTQQSKTKNKEVLSPLQLRAVEIIDQLSQTARDIDDKQTRIRVRALIADVLWYYNPDRSRTVFKEVFDALYSFLTDLQKDKKISRLDSGSSEYQLHRMVLKLISRRDPELAEKLLNGAPEIELFREINEQSPFSLQIAQDIADTNSSRSAQIVRISLKNGINPIIGMILSEIRYNAPDLADKLFLEALAVAQSDPYNIASNISVLAAYVFPSYGGPESETMSELRGAKEANPIVIRRFLEFSYEMIIKRAVEIQPNAIETGNQQMQWQAAFEYNALQQLLPYFSQYMPDKAAVVQGQINYIGRDIPREKIEEIANPFSADRAESLIEKAKAAKSSAERDSFYIRAATFTNFRGDPEKALSIASEIKNEELRSDIESIIRYQAALRALSKEDIDTAYHYARNISILQQYAQIFNKMVRVLGKAKDKQRAEENRLRALDLINEAERSLIKADNGAEKALSTLMLAEAAINIDSNRAFEVMQSAVKALNQIDFNSEGTANKGGVKRIPIGINTFDFNQNLTELAKSDPDRALWLAQSLERKELNVVAQLAVCRGMLNKTPEADNAIMEPAQNKKSDKTPVQKRDRENQVTTPQKKKPS